MMNTTRHFLFWILSAALLTGAFAGCNDAPEYQEQGGDEIDTPDNPVGEGEQEPVAWPEISWCSPRPVAYDVGNIPSLPENVVREGFCDTPSMDLPETFAIRQFLLDTETNTLEVTDPGAVEAPSETTFTFDDAGRVRHVYKYGWRGFYDTSIGASWYDLNVAGEMTHKTAAVIPYDDAPENEWDVIVKEQIWDGDKLLSRVETQGEDGPLIGDYRWTWEGDRLVEARALLLPNGHSTREFLVRFTYNDLGLPAGLERQIEGIAIERQSWTFDDDGVLTGRSFWARSPQDLVAELGGEEADWTFIDGLDDFQRGAHDQFNDDPWALAVPIARGDCMMLPRSPGHGYPDGEEEYQLGVSRTERPVGIGFAYGNDTYAYYYGDLAWYGHDGLGTAWLNADLWDRSHELESTIEYDGSGLMIGETAMVTLRGTQVTATRTRDVGPSGRIAVDTLVAEAGGSELNRKLVFERNDDGHLIGRELLIDGAVAERQTWARDSRGRVTGHEVVEVPDAAPRTFDPDSWTVAFSGFGNAQQQPQSWFWTFDGDLLVARGGTNGEQTLRYDDEGRLVGREGNFTAFDGGGNIERTFDEDGLLVEECTDWGNGETCVRSIYDDAGRLAWREVRNGNDEPSVTDVNLYACH